MSASVDELFQKLLDLGMSEEELENKVKNKVEEYGGFMSKQGVLFVIARENGLDLRSPDINEYIYTELEEEVDYDEFTVDISDLREGMSNIVLLGRILSVEKVREFVRKDESIGKVSSFLLGDITGTVKVVLWDERAENISQESFKIGEFVQVIGGYSKIGRNEALELNLGRKGTLLLSPEISAKKKKLFETVTGKDGEEKTPIRMSLESFKRALQQNKYIRSVKGTVQIEDFKELDLKSGDKSFLLNMFLNVKGFTVRVKAWGLQAVDCLRIVNDGDIITITNLAVKENKCSSEKELVLTKNSKVALIQIA